MEANKENINRLRLSTKIPLPVGPLPALPSRLLFENQKKNMIEPHNIHRQALRTLNTQCPIVAGSSKEKVTTKKQIKSAKVDSRHVTTRHKSEDLDWNYRVFKDERDTSVISISDDESYLEEKEDNELRYFVQNHQRNCLGDMLAVTPAIPELESKSVRNIKRSLKRPHSRELQGLSPMPKQEKKEEDKVKRKLHFSGGLRERSESLDFWKKSYMSCLVRDYTTDMFNYLLSVERKPVDAPRASSVTRACVINWLMKVNGAHGNPAVVQTACWYLDSILGTSQVQLDKLQLIAAACYWIAQKLHGPTVTAMRLVRHSNYAFTAEKLLTAEKAVLRRLNFPRQPVTPQDYIHFLCWWCEQDESRETELAATFLTMAGLMADKAVCENYPSVIAAAAVRNALHLLGKRELITLLHTCPVYKAADKKIVRMAYINAILRRAARTVANPIYEYKAPLEHYGGPPEYIAQRVVNIANELALIDTRNAIRN